MATNSTSSSTEVKAPLSIPAHLFAHTEVQINDNTIRTYTRAGNDNCKILAVFASPKGEDRVMKTIEGGLDEFDDTFGVGPYSLYGQPLLNARAAANTGRVTLQCMRITAPDAAYANSVIWVQYKATPGIPAVPAQAAVIEHDDETGEDVVVTPAVPAQAAVPGKLQVRFVVAPFDDVRSHEEFDDAFDLIVSDPTSGDYTGDAASLGLQNVRITAPEVDTANGWRQMPFIGVVAKGRGSYGNSYHFRISNYPRADKTSSFKNYQARVFEGTQTVEGPTRVTLFEDAIINNTSLYLEEAINGLSNGVSGSRHVHVRVNPDVSKVLYALYTADGIEPDTHLSDAAFDPLLGIDRSLELASSANFESWQTAHASHCGMSSFEIMSDEGSVQFNTKLGIDLTNGSDGAFAISSDPARALARSKAMRVAYYRAFTADTDNGYDRDILSRTKFPLDAIFDADFPIGNEPDANEAALIEGSDDYIATLSVKSAIAELAKTRNEDCFVFMDLGTDRQSILDKEPGKETGFDVKERAFEYSEELDLNINWWNFSVDAYYGKIRDPYNKKIVTVTSTYNLIVNYPKMWYYYGGKHIPYAGSKYGVIDQYIYKTVFPVFDVDLDADNLDKLTDKHVNYAQINSKEEIIRGSQATRYPDLTSALTVSNLSETNNALIILDIKKDAIKLVEKYAYNFNEASDLALFNRDAGQLVSKYREAQVKSISATFSRTEEEAELGILHLTITVIHKALVKINLIDINVERSVQSTT